MNFTSTKTTNLSVMIINLSPTGTIKKNNRYNSNNTYFAF